LKTQPKIDRTFAVEIKDEAGTVIAEVEKVIQIRNR
jgi:hypothetical protein